MVQKRAKSNENRNHALKQWRFSTDEMYNYATTARPFNRLGVTLDGNFLNEEL